MVRSSYLNLPHRFYQSIRPASFPDPQLVMFNSELAQELGLEFSSDAEIAKIFSGKELLPGSEPIAQAYAGAQFGHFVPLLGDGRAHIIGEINGLDIQLKGSGRTQFSRRGDGKSALGPVIREFLVSEAMHALGVPTTRALCAVTTGERVMRMEGPEPGGIFTRVADSHVRVGTFQYFSNQEDLEALTLLTDYVIDRHYPDIQQKDLGERCLELLRRFADRQGDLVAQWFGFGFIHGVMNTDNCSIAGITIDYGPCAFLDEFKFSKVFSSIDRQGRYAYGNQMNITEWNILRFAECLIPLINDNQETAISLIKDALGNILDNLPQRVYQQFGQKLGLGEFEKGDEELVKEFWQYLEEHTLDFTKSFANLDALLEGDTAYFPSHQKLTDFLEQWKSRSPNPSLISAKNPKLIPRNHQIQHAIDHGNEGNYEPMKILWDALKSPFKVADEHHRLTTPPEPNERVYQTFCGT